MATNIYKPNIEMFYGEAGNNNHKISPVPNISISLSYNYSGDSIIGYTYNIQLNGQVTSLDLRNLSFGDSYTIEDLDKRNIGSVTDAANRLRSLLIKNGSILHIADAQSGQVFFKAKGGILREFNIDNSNNNMVATANFSASIEFNEVEINDSQTCSDNFLDITGFPNGGNSDGIVDINKFKIKEFSDSWSFNFDDNSTTKVAYSELGNFLNIDNSFFSLEYTINATGKNYYNYSNEDNSTSTLLPAWEQAKNFAQNRLYYQVTNLINGVLKTYSDPCVGDDLNAVNIPGSSSSGLLSSLSDSKYRIFNEEVTCDFSESAGTFSAVYKCTVRKNNDTLYSRTNCFHTITKSIKSSGQGRKNSRTITISGNIQGLIEGGIIRTNQPLELPKSGKLLIYNTASTAKIDNANTLKQALITGDLPTVGFKSVLGINRSAFSNTAGEKAGDPSTKSPTSISVTYNYLEGTIDYNFEYSSDQSLCGIYSNISINTTEPTKLFVLHDIPGSNSVGVLQKLGTYSAKTVQITAEGIDRAARINPSSINISSLSNGWDYDISDIIGGIDNGFGAITEKTTSFNPLTGRFTVNINYMCQQIC